MKNTPKRPVYLNLLQFRFAVTALVSIGHRIGGVLLFLSLPLFIYLFDLSLRGPEGFATATALLHGDGVRLVLVLLLWAAAHHLLAGLRFLFIDLDLGVELPVARATARGVGLGALAILCIGVVLLW